MLEFVFKNKVKASTVFGFFNNIFASGEEAAKEMSQKKLLDNHK